DRRACSTKIIVFRWLRGFLTRICTAEEWVRNLELILVRLYEISAFNVRMEVQNVYDILCLMGLSCDNPWTKCGPKYKRFCVFCSHSLPRAEFISMVFC